MRKDSYLSTFLWAATQSRYFPCCCVLFRSPLGIQVYWQEWLNRLTIHVWIRPPIVLSLDSRVLADYGAKVLGDPDRNMPF